MVSDPLFVPAFGRTGLPPTAALRLTADCRKIRRPRKSPRTCAMPTLPASLLATGRGWAHSPSHVAAIGAWKESGMARGPGGPTATVAVEAPAMARSAATAPQGHMAGKVLEGADHRLQIRSGTQIAARGRRKAAQGTRGSQEAPTRSLEAGPAGSAGAGGKPAPGLPRGTRVPVAPSRTPPGRRGTDGACANSPKGAHQYERTNAPTDRRRRRRLRLLTRDLCRPAHVRCALSRQTRA